jgi:hypothetical protein
VDDAELARRLAAWRPPAAAMASGYWKLYIDHVLQADQGADLDFLVGKRGARCPRTTTDQRYQRALAASGHPVRLAPDDATWHGLLAVARAAGLVAGAVSTGTLPA